MVQKLQIVDNTVARVLGRVVTQSHPIKSPALAISTFLSPIPMVVVTYKRTISHPANLPIL